ncbi:MAG: SMP-30/gluconolactonase/LRE family protein [Spirochaetales bacterium]|nr:SMP-30/gluconolactonase/LRE family protein [Spirochaetales bacterium]
MKTFVLLSFLLLLVSCAWVPKTVIRAEDTLIESFSPINGEGGCENICLDDQSLRVYVTDLKGYVHLLDGTTRRELKEQASLKLDEYALGICLGPDGYLYAAAGGMDWLDTDCAIYRVDRNLSGFELLTKTAPGTNGLAINRAGELFFAAGNLKLMHPKGAIYRMSVSGADRTWPELFIAGLKSPNGMFIEDDGQKLVFSETFHGVRCLAAGTEVERVCGKSRLVEGFDDLCRDQYGNYWIADPPNGFIKCYDPAANLVTCYHFDAIGIASSCRTRIENGREYLYVTEIKKSSKSKSFDGRGIFVFSVDVLLAEKR